MKKPLLDQRWPWILAAVAIVLAFLSTLVEVRFGDAADPRPTGSVDDIMALRERSDTNVLFILIDMLRADRLGAYGYARDTSPNLDRLAATGVRFERQLSQSSWTKASMASLWTSMVPARTGILRFDDVLPDDARMPAEILRDAGFLTTGIWRNGWVASTFGFQQGFDVYTRPTPRPHSVEVQRRNPTIKQRGTDEDAVGAAVEFLRIHGDEHWFLYLHLMDVHEYLYDEESALFGGAYSDIYDNAIRWNDSVIGVLLAYLADMDLTRKTLIVVGSDHGEAFRERGHEGHARQVFRESTEVPLILSFPFRLEEGIRVARRTRNIDLWPTVLDLIGLEPAPGIDGQSLVPDILAAGRGEAPEKDPTAFAELDQTWGQRGQPPRLTLAVVDGPLRYVRVSDHGPRREHLFDATNDPTERQDHAASDPEDLARLREAADAYLRQSPPWGKAPTREIGEMELNQLRALGYAIP